MRTAELFKWMQERHAIYTRRQAGKPKPWTKDPILQSYRFCNVYRELDTVTEWIAANWRKPHAKDRHLWFAMVVARLFNRPDTLVAIGYGNVRNYNRGVLERRLAIVKKSGDKVFSGAYIVSTNGKQMDKVPYLLEYVLDPLWKDREIIADAVHSGNTLGFVHKVLMTYDGLGSFMAAQVVADLKYVKPLLAAPDWHTWAASGPGSRRGLNRIYQADVDRPWRESEWWAYMDELHTEINKMITKNKMPALHAQDLQNCLCEFDKYERTRLGEGRPRSTYKGI